MKASKVKLKSEFVSWEQALKETLNNKEFMKNNLMFDVINAECSKCHAIVNGKLFINKQSSMVSDSYGFMVFDEIVCDRCVGEPHGTKIITISNNKK